MLIIVENGNVHEFPELSLNLEAFGRFDVFQVDAPKRRAQLPYTINELLWISLVYTDVDGVQLRETFEQNTFPLHHWLGGSCAKVSET